MEVLHAPDRCTRHCRDLRIREVVEFDLYSCVCRKREERAVSDIVIEKCATKAIAEKRRGYWLEEPGFTAKILQQCTVSKGEANAAGKVTTTDSVFENAAFVVLVQPS